MTLADLRTMEKEFLTPAEVAKVLHADALFIRYQARKDPAALGFPVIVYGHRTKIPRVAFINFMQGTQIATADPIA